jgi:AhpD family alkylhydroperoxidase
MFEFLAKAFLDRFEREWGYDVSYAREMLAAGGYEAIKPMNALQKISSYRGGCPDEVLATAAVMASRAGDCGPCLQLTVKMAERRGVDPQQLRAVLERDRDAMNDDVRVAYDFTRAVLARDGWDVPAREEVVRRFGKPALIALSYTIALAGFYPTFKYAYGAGKACQRITVGSFDVAPI